MRIHYGVLSQGQGHLNRSAGLIRTLRARGHRVDVLVAGDPPPAYANQVLGDFDFLELPNLSLEDGRLRYRRTAVRFMGAMPRRALAVSRLAHRFARRRVDLVLSDWEPVTAWAAFLARAPSAGIAGQYRMTRTDAVGPKAPVDRALTHGLIESWTPGLSRYFAVTFSPLSATRPRTKVVPPIVDERVRGLAPRREGFFLAYLYTYPKERVLAVLRGLGRFRVYGLGVDEQHGEIALCRTDRGSFIDDLARCDGVIFNGSFQGVCEAVSLGKPVLSIPFSRQYEEAFNAFQVQRAGLGMAAPRLTRRAIEGFVRSAKPLLRTRATARPRSSPSWGSDHGAGTFRSARQGTGAPRPAAGDQSRGFPSSSSVKLELTNFCNHDCHFCAYRRVVQDPARKEMLPTARVLELIDELSAGGVKAVMFTGGGEPLLHPDLEDIFARCRTHHLAHALITNGERLGAISDDGLEGLTWIRFSINAGDEQTYTRVHGSGPRAWERVWAQVRRAANKERFGRAHGGRLVRGHLVEWGRPRACRGAGPGRRSLLRPLPPCLPGTGHRARLPTGRSRDRRRARAARGAGAPRGGFVPGVRHRAPVRRAQLAAQGVHPLPGDSPGGLRAADGRRLDLHHGPRQGLQPRRPGAVPGQPA